MQRGDSRVDVGLEETGEGMRLRLRHSGLPPDSRQSHAEGWDYFLPSLLREAERAI